ncbi:MAG: Gfo/Idh/MocA family oxidoreductase [Acidobacteria bacterium]|nr:Gfo/Idh/MocA family oxidoreductase [Acidobacteriota bacterium]
MTRRNFLQASSAAGFALMGARAADKPRRVALIGTGWYGKSDLFRLIQVADVEVVGLCDADSKMLAAAANTASERQKSGKTPKTYSDYHELLKQEQPDITLIATPDHWHALPMIEACKAGCDIYVQKPISVDVIEGQAMLAAARKYKRVVQVGTQRRSTPHLIEAKERFLDEGKLGKISHVEICCYYHMRTKENPPDEAPPANLDYELWTGPAPMRPYNKLVHPRRWRAFMEYGNGIMGDMCIHMLDMVRWMMNLGWPASVSSTGGIFVDKASKANITDTQTAVFAFPEVNVVWTHRTWGRAADPDYPWAAIIYGEKGTLKASVNGYDYIPMDKNEKPIHKDVVYELEQYPIDKVEPELEKHVAPAIRGHMRDLLAAIDKRSRPVADIEQGFISTTSCILANMSLDLGGRELKYDPAKGVVTGDKRATDMLARPYRKPYSHPDPKKV